VISGFDPGSARALERRYVSVSSQIHCSPYRLPAGVGVATNSALSLTASSNLSMSADAVGEPRNFNLTGDSVGVGRKGVRV
jgi:hypothetical protein